MLRYRLKSPPQSRKSVHPTGTDVFSPFTRLAWCEPARLLPHARREEYIVAMKAPLPIRSLHHVARLTKHLAESRAFYRDVLGFREIRRPDLSFPGAWLCNYGLQIHLIVDDSIGSPAGPIDTRAHHLAFYVDDSEPIARMLEEHGVPYRVNIQTGTGLKQIFFRDPDGHHIEIGTYPPAIELDPGDAR